MEKKVAPPLGQSWNEVLGWHYPKTPRIIYLDDKGRIQFRS